MNVKTRKSNRAVFTAMTLLIGICSVATGTEPIVISSATVLLIDERDVSAADSGLLHAIHVAEGDEIKKLQTLASLTSDEQTLAVDAARLALDAAIMEQKNPLPVAIAKSSVNEAIARLDRTKAELQIAERQATDTFLLQIAKTESEAATAELKQATEARAKHRMSVSDSEYRKLTAVAQKGRLQVSQSASDLEVKKLQSRIYAEGLKEQTATVARQKLLLQQEERNSQLHDLTVSARQKDLALAKLLHARRSIDSPIDGIVAEVYHKPSEWVEKGAAIVKVIDLKKLRMEGFVGVQYATANLIGGKVSIRFPLIPGQDRAIEGVVTHVAPQVDTVNQRLRLWAEFPNKDRHVLPGMVGEMVVTPAANLPKDRSVE